MHDLGVGGGRGHRSSHLWSAPPAAAAGAPPFASPAPSPGKCRDTTPSPWKRCDTSPLGQRTGCRAKRTVGGCPGSRGPHIPSVLRRDRPQPRPGSTPGSEAPPPSIITGFPCTHRTTLHLKQTDKTVTDGAFAPRPQPCPQSARKLSTDSSHISRPIGVPNWL